MKRGPRTERIPRGKEAGRVRALLLEQVKVNNLIAEKSRPDICLVKQINRALATAKLISPKVTRLIKLFDLDSVRLIKISLKLVNFGLTTAVLLRIFQFW